MPKKLKKLHKGEVLSKTSGGVYEKCTVCGATRLSRFTYGWYPWKLYGKPMPYCPGQK